MRNTLLKIKKYRQEITKENEENKNLGDPTQHIKILKRKIKSEYLDQKIPSSRIDKIKSHLKYLSDDSNTNTKRKLEHFDKTIYIQLRENYDDNIFNIAIDELYKKEKRKAFIYKISRSLFKLFTILFPFLLLSHIIFFFFPTKNFKLFLTIVDSLFDVMCILLILALISSSKLNLIMKYWLDEYFRRKKNRTQVLLIKVYEKTYSQLQHIKNLKIKINKNIIALITKQEANKTGILNYLTPPLIASFFFVLFKNNFLIVPGNTKTKIRDFLISTFDFSDYKPDSLKKYFNKNDKDSFNSRNKLHEMLEIAKSQVSKNINDFDLSISEQKKEKVYISESIREDVEYLYHEISKSKLKINMREDYFCCILEIFFSNPKKNERIILNENYAPKCLKEVYHLLDKMTLNTL